LLSYELAQFLSVEPGTCMTMKEVHNKMIEYTSSRNVKTSVIKMDTKLRKLFGINENEEYELKSTNLASYLKPHLKVIV
jgi:chromatin remodeling complex protein RSC6